MSNELVIVGGNPGFHNEHLKAARDRLKTAKGYKDLSTVCVIPTRGVLGARVVEYWFQLATPMNQQFYRIWMKGLEVADAYNQAIEMILDNPVLSKCKYLLTLEEDNMPPSDGLLRLYESMDEYAIVAGLYWTKGFAGQPMIYGNPKRMEISFQPQVVKPNVVQECNGVGMGFTLFRMSLFRDKKIEKPWFKTSQEPTEGKGTQDLYFMSKVRKAGYRIASDNRVRVGHYDIGEDFQW